MTNADQFHAELQQNLDDHNRELEKSRQEMLATVNKEGTALSRAGWRLIVGPTLADVKAQMHPDETIISQMGGDVVVMVERRASSVK